MNLPGLMAIIAATTIWGVSGIYFSLFPEVPTLEIVAHRTFWSLIFFLVILCVQGRVHELWTVIKDSRLLLRVLAGAVMVAFNWFVFVYAIQTGQATEASFGYFILPLITAALAAFVLKEEFSKAQVFAIGLAVIAVLVLAIGLGKVPIVGLVLAATFAVYSLIKKQLPIGPVLSVAIEVALVGPLLMAWVVWHNGGAGALTASWMHAAWLIGFIIFTGFPLMLFSFGSKRLPLLTVGLATYVNPTMQFFVAAFYFSEPIGWPHLVAFPLIWIGLAIHTIDMLRQERARKASIKLGTSGAVL